LSLLALFFFGLFPGALGAQLQSPAGPVSPDLLQARRSALLKALDGAPAIVSSAGSRGAYAQDSDYREDNDFFYLTGLEAPGGWLVFNGARPGDAVLYLPPRSPRAEQWTGRQLGPGSEAEALTGLPEVKSTEALGNDVQVGLTRARQGGALEVAGVYVSMGDSRTQEELVPFVGNGGIDLHPLGPFLAQLRLVKDDEELRRMRKAADITMEAHREVWRFSEPGHFEYEAEAALEYVFHSLGAERVGFSSIVGSGPNSVILHYDRSRRRMGAGELVVVDIGAEYGYYTADITRTFPVSGRFTPRQKSLYDLVLGTREAALEVIRPGATIGDVNAAAQAFLRENSGTLCGNESCAPYLIHGVSHWLGMDVHDVGSNRTPFSPGMVITLEPGLYLPEESLGIRIEDDILITADGHEVLSEGLPRATEEIEAIMGEEPRWVRGPAHRPQG